MLSCGRTFRHRVRDHFEDLLYFTHWTGTVIEEVSCGNENMSTFWLSRDEVREFDRRASAEFGVPGLVLMENAGRGCAELLMRLNSDRKPVVVLCGPGNNGGDGYVIARHLDNVGIQVTILGVAVPASAQDQGKVTVGGWSYEGLPPDARINSEIVTRSGINRFPLSAQSFHPGARNSLTDVIIKTECWIVDALFGTGLSRALTAPDDELVALVNASGQPVLAVDIPSGLDCDTGAPLGPTVRAMHTATFVAHKRGFLNEESREWTGTIHVVDIGAPRILVEEYRKRRKQG